MTVGGHDVRTDGPSGIAAGPAGDELMAGASARPRRPVPGRGLGPSARTRFPGALRFAVALWAACLAPSGAAADWKAFIPRPLDNGAYLDLFTSFERDESRTTARPARWTDTFIREKLTLYSNGYSYHPRFLLYQFSIGATGRQEDYDSNTTSLGWRHGSGLEYNAKVLLLPEHPYNLEAYASRYEPLFKEHSAVEHNSVATTHGASVRYRKKPYFLNVSYANQTVESARSSSDVTRVGVNGEYFKRYASGNELSVNGGFNPSWFSNSQGTEGDSQEYLLGNLVKWRRVQLHSSLSKNTFDQETLGTNRFENDQFVWYERLTARLPWHFRTNLSHRWQDSESIISNAAAAQARTLSDKSKNLQFDLIHKLYRSLDTTYTFRRGARTSFAGETTALSNALALNYTKSIPRGRILAGTSLGRTETDNRGQVDIVDEPHSGVAVPGVFTLQQQNAEPTSIEVFLRSPLPPFETVRLVEGVHYTKIPAQNTFEIQVFALPPEFVVPEAYDFFVTYSLLTGDFELRTDTFGGNASVQLFDNLLTPYFGYVTVRSDVLAGVFPGIPVDSTTYTTGLLVHRGPVRARGEYQKLEWEVSPYEAWKAEVQYVSALTPTTSVYATTAYLNKHYPQGLSAFVDRAFTEETVSVSGSIQKRLLRDMYASTGGSYSWRQGLVDSNAYSLNAALMWRIGRTDLTVGASAYGADTTGAGVISTEREHQYFYVRLRRKLL